MTINDIVGKTFNFSSFKNIRFTVRNYTSNENWLNIEMENGEKKRRKLYKEWCYIGGVLQEGQVLFIKEQNEWCYLRTGRVCDWGGQPPSGAPIETELDAIYME